MKITVRQPKGRIYPVCDKAKLFLKLISPSYHEPRVTFHPSEILVIEALGVEVEYESDD